VNVQEILQMIIAVNIELEDKKCHVIEAKDANRKHYI
jgi:hypothetical protein